MKNTPTNSTCNCPMECDHISYFFSLVSTPFEAEEMCPGGSGSQDFLMKEFYENVFPPQYIRKIKEFSDNSSSNEKDICKKNIQYRAHVIFRLATNSIPVTIMSRRLSFFNKLSDFGKFWCDAGI